MLLVIIMEADDKVKYDIIKMATINRIDKAMVVITMMDNETKYLLDTRNHKIFTKFTPDLKGLAECTYIERFTNTSKEAQRAYKKKYNELKNEMLEINLAYIPILREYEDILSKIVK